MRQQGRLNPDSGRRLMPRLGTVRQAQARLGSMCIASHRRALERIPETCKCVRRAGSMFRTIFMRTGKRGDDAAGARRRIRSARIQGIYGYLWSALSAGKETMSWCRRRRARFVGARVSMVRWVPQHGTGPAGTLDVGARGTRRGAGRARPRIAGRVCVCLNWRSNGKRDEGARRDRRRLLPRCARETSNTGPGSRPNAMRWPVRTTRRSTARERARLRAIRDQELWTFRAFHGDPRFLDLSNACRFEAAWEEMQRLP